MRFGRGRERLRTWDAVVALVVVYSTQVLGDRVLIGDDDGVCQVLVNRGHDRHKVLVHLHSWGGGGAARTSALMGVSIFHCAPCCAVPGVVRTFARELDAPIERIDDARIVLAKRQTIDAVCVVEG